MCKDCQLSHNKARNELLRLARIRKNTLEIARKYGVTVEELATWDGVKRPCVKCETIQSVDQFRENCGSCKDCERQYSRTYRNLRLEHSRALERAKKRRHHANNPASKVATRLRTRIWLALKGKLKADTLLSLTGCSFEWLTEYIQQQFTPEMSWENYGTFWEIDHILPCAAFDLTLKSEQMTCFHFTNLQPLKCKHNRSKAAKIFQPQMSLPI